MAKHFDVQPPGEQQSIEVVRVAFQHAQSALQRFGRPGTQGENSGKLERKVRLTGGKQNRLTRVGLGVFQPPAGAAGFRQIGMEYRLRLDLHRPADELDRFVGAAQLMAHEPEEMQRLGVIGPAGRRSASLWRPEAASRGMASGRSPSPAPRRRAISRSRLASTRGIRSGEPLSPGNFRTAQECP